MWFIQLSLVALSFQLGRSAEDGLKFHVQLNLRPSSMIPIGKIPPNITKPATEKENPVPVVLDPKCRFEPCCPGGPSWALSYPNICTKTIPVPSPQMNREKASAACEKIGGVLAPMTNSGQEAAIQKSLKQFRNSSKTSELIMLGHIKPGGLPRNSLVQFWIYMTDIDEGRFRPDGLGKSRTEYSKFDYEHDKKLDYINTGYYSSDERCVVYNSDTMLIETVYCDCIGNFTCPYAPPKITAITCAQFATLNELALPFGSRKEFSCEKDWIRVADHSICIQGFKAPSLPVSYHSAEVFCNQYDARPASVQSQMEADLALYSLSLVFPELPDGYTKSIMVGRRYFPTGTSYLDADMWYRSDSDGSGLLSQNFIKGLATRTPGISFSRPNANSTNPHYCMIWDVNFGLRSWFCDPKEKSAQYPIEAIVCEKQAAFRFTK